MKGAYVLLIQLESGKEIGVGSLGTIHFPQGFYLYIGSAMNGIKARVNRHLRNTKKIHWHIDYLLKNAKVIQAYNKEGKKGLECSLSRKLNKNFLAIPRFGSSDCSCTGHLFLGEKEDLIQFLQKNNMKKFDLHGL